MNNRLECKSVYLNHNTIVIENSLCTAQQQRRSKADWVNRSLNYDTLLYTALWVGLNYDTSLQRSALGGLSKVIAISNDMMAGEATMMTRQMSACDLLLGAFPSGVLQSCHNLTQYKRPADSRRNHFSGVQRRWRHFYDSDLWNSVIFGNRWKIRIGKHIYSLLFWHISTYKQKIKLRWRLWKISIH